MLHCSECWKWPFEGDSISLGNWVQNFRKFWWKPHHFVGKVDIFWRPVGSNDAPSTSIRYLISSKSSDLMRYLLMKHHKQQNQQHWFLFVMAANSWCFVEIIVNCPQQSRVTKSTQMHWKPPSLNVWPWVEYSQSCWIFSTLGCKRITALRYQLKHQLLYI